MPEYEIQFMLFQLFDNWYDIVEEQISNFVKGWVT